MMVIGADVYHPGPSSRSKSIAAYVASMDENCATYHTSLREQPGEREEALVDLYEVLTKMLHSYRKRNGGFPVRILFYRDDAGETQGTCPASCSSSTTPQLLMRHRAYGCHRMAGTKELTIIHRVFQDLHFNPALTFVLVKKRNITRLYQNQSGQRYQNPSPGTFVNVEEGKIFWLCSHYALQGTSRVPSYHILHNEQGTNCGGEMSTSEIAQMTYDLCHLHYKCPRSVSVPAPVYYADIAADRATALYHNGNFRGGDLNEQQSRRLFY